MRPGFQLVFYVIAIVVWLAAALVPRLGQLRLNLLAVGLVVIALPTTIDLAKDAFGVDRQGILPF